MAVVSNEFGEKDTNIQTNYVDLDPPEVNIVNWINDTLSGIVSFQGTNIEDFSSVSGFWYRINSQSWIASMDSNIAWNISGINTSLFTNGPFTFEVMSSNEAGLVNTFLVTNYISNVGPVVMITNPNSMEWITNLTYDFAGWSSNKTGTITGVYFGTNNTELSLVNGTTNWFTNGVNLNGLDNTSNIFYVMASNEYGLVTTNSQINRIDFDPPMIAITNHVNQTLSKTVSFVGTNWDDFAPITGFWWKLNNNAWSPASNNNMVWNINNIDTTLLSNGPFTFEIMSSNEAGWTTVAIVTNFVSNFRPIVTIVAPTNDAYLIGYELFRGVASNISVSLDPLSNYFQIDGGSINYMGSSNIFFTNINSSNLSDGYHVFKIISINSAGFSNEYIQTNLIDNSPPIVGINPTGVLSGIENLSGTFADGDSGVISLIVILSNSSFVQTNIPTMLGGNWTLEIDWSQFQNDDIDIVVVAENGTGLIETISISATIFNTLNSLNDLLIGPNPFILGESGSLIMAINVTEFSEMKIYSVNGGHIISFDVSYIIRGSDFYYLEWDLLDKNGHAVAPGVYIIRVFDNEINEEKMVKVTIISQLR